MSERYNYQLVVIDTDQGTALSEEGLKEMWEARLKKEAPHYRVVGVFIKKNQGKER